MSQRLLASVGHDRLRRTALVVAPAGRGQATERAAPSGPPLSTESSAPPDAHAGGRRAARGAPPRSPRLRGRIGVSGSALDGSRVADRCSASRESPHSGIGGRIPGRAPAWWREHGFRFPLGGFLSADWCAVRCAGPVELVPGCRCAARSGLHRRVRRRERGDGGARIVRPANHLANQRCYSGCRVAAWRGPGHGRRYAGVVAVNRSGGFGVGRQCGCGAAVSNLGSLRGCVVAHVVARIA
ncbi:hypothetical protein F4561_000443 [Lipingzhangella halophila]|uniref:Uncharacterized protein n=1 Tax=Lipingzhangella halophila TaxID=1783352 RepID=A0A7W7W0U6_9ACTN|nr:hypothetical protein [Lipingzhangella halophila]